MNSNVSKDDILDVKPESRPIIIPNAIIGYFGDLIINISKHRVSVQKGSR